MKEKVKNVICVGAFYLILVLGVVMINARLEWQQKNTTIADQSQVVQVNR